MERERTREPDPTQLSGYEKLVRHYQEMAHRQRTGRLLIKGDEIDYQPTRQGLLKFYLNPLVTDTRAASSSSSSKAKARRRTTARSSSGRRATSSYCRSSPAEARATSTGTATIRRAAGGWGCGT
jgi:hypothetical protein